MRTGMKNEKRQLELIRAHELFRQRAQRVRVELRVSGREINQVIRVREHRLQMTTLRMPQKGGDLLPFQWPGEPLHVVLHEDLHGRAIDRTGAFDRAMQPAANRRVSAKKNLRLPRSHFVRIFSDASSA